MNVEYEKLLRALYVTWDITDGVTERDFGFVRCGGSGPNGVPTAFRPGRDHGIPFRSLAFMVDEFDENVPGYLRWVFQNPTHRLSESERLDSRVFRLGDLKIRCPGPIGVMTIKGPYRSFRTFDDRYEAAT